MTDTKAMTTATETRPATPLDIVNHAMQSGREISLDQIEKLYELQERHEKNEARKAYHNAIAEFKAKSFRINKDKNGHNCMFASLPNILDVVTPHLSEFGLSLSWETARRENLICVTAVLSHKQGHSEKTYQESAPDTSGGKNAIQAVGSAQKYLMRYTAEAILGIAAHDKNEDDGKAMDERITEKQHSEILDMMLAKNIIEADFLGWLNGQKGTSISDMAELPARLHGFVISTIKSVGA